MVNGKNLKNNKYSFLFIDVNIYFADSKICVRRAQIGKPCVPVYTSIYK